MNRSFMHKIMAALFAIVIIATAQAQAPQKFNYQAALRTNNNVPIINTPVSVRISIVKDSATGTVVYTETQTTTSNSNGVISLQIGTGKAVSGNFSTINWGAGNYYVKTETDPTGGTNYTTSGTAQLLSVPYALYAANSGTTGAAGKDGVSVSATKIIRDSLFVTLSNGQTLNAGNVRGAQGIQGIQGLTGLTGTKGDSGVRGLQGIQGIQGLKGDQGIQGIQGLIGATGLKGDSGARGLQGIQGIQGLKGDQGIQGIQGLTGATGLKGDSGARGLQGIQGIQGLKGDQGIQGIQGLTGLTGAKGDSGARGLQGIQGIQGLKGDQGIQGIQGAKGDSGVKGLQGIQGIQGIQGLTGAIGAKGDSGARGLQGIQGIQGLKGDQGIQGIQGLTGVTGVKGDSGARGLQGIQGIQGLKGDSGVNVRMTVVNGDSLYITLNTGQTINAGLVRGMQGVSVDSINMSNDTLLTYKSNGTIAKTIYTPTVSQGIKIGISSSTTWICPVGITQITVELWGGSGGGGSSSAVGVVFSNPGPRGFWHSGDYNIYGRGNGISNQQGIGVMFNITGGSGGNGGSGGYSKQIISVVSGQSYNITIGTGGTGGGCCNGYNGSDGIAGTSSSFNNIIYADGGTQGTGGQVTVGPTGSWNDQRSYPNDNGGGTAINGTIGNSGSKLNYNYPTTNYGSGTRTYIPTTLITPIPSQSAPFGLGGGAISANCGYWDQTNSIAGNSGGNGEAGYCIISY